MEFVGLFLNKSDPRPLYGQLYDYFSEGIRAGRVKAGERLPGKRSAATQLGVSVNTVDEAYQMLAAEGYVEARPRSGFVVQALGQAVPPPAVHREELAPPEAPASPWRYSFATGGIDTTLFPRKSWNRLQREVLAEEEDDLFGTGEPMGDGVLREAIAAYLQSYRGVQCHARQIVVGAGLEVLVSLLGPLLPPGAVAVENPGYPKTAHILGNVGRQVLPLEVDGAGLPPEALYQSGAGAAYLTPSHHFPTGAVMPAWRRSSLLAWAAERGGVLIEDDYDSEFRFDGRPLPSLQGLDSGGHVIYAGTFSRSLAPGIRAAYLVLPHGMLHRWQGAYRDYACTVWRPEQHTLARFMAGGHFARSINRMRAAYRRRRDLLLSALAEELHGIEYEVENAHTGLYFVLRLPGRNAAALAEAAREQGLRLRSLGSYRMPADKENAGQATPPDDALLLGYGGLPDTDVPAAACALAKVLRPL